jgi:NADH-quinone oxidoreductase subunit L
VGIGIAWMFYGRPGDLAARLATSLRPLYLVSLNKFYLDEILWALVVAPLRGLARISAILDVRLIDGIVDSVGRFPRLLSDIPRRLHNGLVPAYAMVMWIGVVVGVLAMLGIFHR